MSLSDEYWIERMSDHQLVQLHRKGKHQECIQQVWLKRWGMDYPMYKSVKGIERYE
jgi:hypothetical protein